MSGPTGLDYAPVFRLMDMEDLPRNEWLDLLDDIQVMEAQAMKTMTGRDDG